MKIEKITEEYIKWLKVRIKQEEDFYTTNSPTREHTEENINLAIGHYEGLYEALHKVYEMIDDK